MDTFLQVVGAGVLIVVGALVLLGLGLWVYIRYQVGQLKKLAKHMGGPVAPVRVSLQTASQASWPDPSKADQLKHEFQQNGFVYVDTYEIPGMEGMLMMGFANPGESTYGTITHHPMTGYFIEVVQRAVDGAAVTVTQSKLLSQARPVNKTVVSLPNAKLPELVQELRSLRPAGDLEPHTPERFKQAFEDAYYESMKFAYEFGDLKGTDPDLVADLIQQRADPETLALLRELDREPDTEEKLTEAYLAKSGMSALDWEKQRDKTVFVYDELATDDIGYMFEEYMADEGDPYDQVDSMQGENARETFARAAQHLHLFKRPEYVMHLEEPVACDVYRF